MTTRKMADFSLLAFLRFSFSNFRCAANNDLSSLLGEKSWCLFFASILKFFAGKAKYLHQRTNTTSTANISPESTPTVINAAITQYQLNTNTSPHQHVTQRHINTMSYNAISTSTPTHPWHATHQAPNPAKCRLTNAKQSTRSPDAFDSRARRWGACGYSSRLNDPGGAVGNTVHSQNTSEKRGRENTYCTRHQTSSIVSWTTLSVYVSLNERSCVDWRPQRFDDRDIPWMVQSFRWKRRLSMQRSGWRV